MTLPAGNVVSTTQIAPTLLDLAGAPPLAGAQGRSLGPLLRGEPWQPTEALFSEMEQHIDPLPARAVRTERHKYVRNLSDAPWGLGDGDAAYFDALALEPGQTWATPRVPEELYDLDADPLERVNLVDDPAHADVLEAMRGRLREHAAQTADPRLPEL